MIDVINTDQEFKDFTRWVDFQCKVWERRSWGWKFLGVSKSQNPVDILELLTNDCDHPQDIFDKNCNQKVEEF